MLFCGIIWMWSSLPPSKAAGVVLRIAACELAAGPGKPLVVSLAHSRNAYSEHHRSAAATGVSLPEPALSGQTPERQAVALGAVA
jgi:hypothetical protein